MTLFLDACIVIYWVEAVYPWYERLTQRLAALKAAGVAPQLAVSVLSRLECRIKPLREDDLDPLGKYQEFLGQPEMRIIGIDDAVIEAATVPRARYGLKTPDALQAACALNLGDGVIFLTNDRRFGTVPKLRFETV